MSPSWVSIALLILWCTPVLQAQIYHLGEDEDSEERSLTCMCTTSQCQHKKFCITQYKCYFEQQFTKDGKNEMKWGCISSSNSLLCENRIMPRKSFIYCCDDKDFCNLQNVTGNLPLWMLFSPRGGKQSRDTSVPIDGYSSNVKPESNSKILSTTNSNPIRENFTLFGNGTLFKDSPSCTVLSTTVVQMMLMVSLVIMMGIFGFGVYVLKTHSNFNMRYMTRSDFLRAHRHCIVRSEARNVCVTTPATVSVIPSQQRTMSTTAASETNSEEESSLDKTSPEEYFSKLSSFTSVISPIAPLITTPIPSLAPTTTASPKYTNERLNVPASVTVEMSEPSKDL